jgi:hypothetical protein
MEKSSQSYMPLRGEESMPALFIAEFDRPK